MNRWDEPFLTTCDACDHKTAAMPGPRMRRGRPEPPAGFRIGYEIEQSDRSFTLCWQCFQHVLQAA